MNLASHEGDNESNILFANFNQDCSSISVGLKTGYRLFTVNAVDKLEVVYGNDSSECSEVCAVDRLYSSSLVAFVSIQSPRKLHVCHFKKGAEICNYSYSNTILSVRLSKQRLVVCLEESLYIHNIKDMILLHTIRDTPSNPDGLFALSTAENCLLAYPGGRDVGEVQLFDALNLRATGIVLAHNSPLAAIAFNPSGSRIATASVKGTVIRVFSVPDGQRLFDFRRGVKRCATINCLAFSPDSLFLGCSSNTETVHVFRLESAKEKPQEEPQTWMGYVGQALKASVSYLPSSMSDMLNQDRAFAQARLASSGLKNLCAITCIQKVLCLLVLSQDGYLYIYKLDAKEGGECVLLKQHRLDGEPATSPRRSSRCCSTGTLTHGSSHHNEAEVPGAAGGTEHSDNLRLDDVNEFPPVSSSVRRELN